MKLASIASTAKVPLPWIGTQSNSPAVSPASATSRRRSSAVMARKSSSHEPQSRSIAALTE